MIPMCRCGKTYRDGDRYCYHCGRELKQPCPLCGNAEFRLLEHLESLPSPWCVRAEAMPCCASCGRWLPKGVRRCPNERCQGNVVPRYPASAAGAWTVPHKLPEARLPELWQDAEPPLEEWEANAPIYAALSAYDHLFVWTEAGLTCITYSDTRCAPLPRNFEPDQEFRSRPADALAPTNRLICGADGLIAAFDDGFYQLSPVWGDAPEPCVSGIPLAQAANAWWWAGWVQEGVNPPTLWVAPNGNQQPRQVELPDEAQPQTVFDVACHGNTVWWLSEQGIWHYDCENTTAFSQLFPIASGVPRKMVFSVDGIAVAIDTGTRFSVRFFPLQSHRTAKEWSVPERVVHELHLTPQGVAFRGNRLYFGSWDDTELVGHPVDEGRLLSALHTAPDGSPRLVKFAGNAAGGQLRIVLQPYAGREHLVWEQRAAHFQPLQWIMARTRFYAVHHEGVVWFDC